MTSTTSHITDGLNPAQKEAVTKSFKNPTVVIAGAGSGKTRVLTKRIEYMLAKNVRPTRILAVTFTNKASKEMTERLRNAIGDAAKKVSIGTFHSLAVRWLYQYYAEAGLQKNWTIFDTSDCDQLIKKILTDHGMDDSKQTVYSMRAAISDAKNQLITPQAYSAKATYETKEVAIVYEKYQLMLQKYNAVDFDDLIMKTVFMLEGNTDVRNKFQKRFKYVMCDEFQDTNSAQYRMLNAIVGSTNNLFVVGDDWQGIYGWRGANVENILNFQNDYPNAKIIYLEENYRSTQTVVDAGNAVVSNNAMRSEKVCFSSAEKGSKIQLFTGNSDVQEAQFIAEEIKNLSTFENLNYGDIAILYRTNVQSRLLEDAFIKMNIPYNMVSGFSFYERKEIKDILSWLHLSVNPNNDLACKRILQMQEGIGVTSIKGMEAKAGSRSLYETALVTKLRTTKGQASLTRIIATIDQLSHYYDAGKDVTDTPITDMFELVLKNTQYIDKLREDATEESSRRIDNILELLKMAEEFELEVSDATLPDFLNNIALHSQSDDLDTDKVQMMTLHTSKGLEYHTVFMIGMEEGLFPHQNSMSTEHQLEEERRLCYVGITRAQKNLYMTNAKARKTYSGSYNYNKPSRFISELPDELVERI